MYVGYEELRRVDSALWMKVVTGNLPIDNVAPPANAVDHLQRAFDSFKISQLEKVKESEVELYTLSERQVNEILESIKEHEQSGRQRKLPKRK